jgi:VWFA-related protein
MVKLSAYFRHTTTTIDGTTHTGPFARRLVFLPLILGLTVAMAVTRPAFSQVEVVPRTSAVFNDSIDVELVNIDVFVTDRRGNPNTELSIDDFEVIVDGVPVTISHFAAVGTATKKVSDEDAVLKMSTESLSAESQPPPNVAQEGLLPHLVVVFDGRHITHIAKRRLMKGLREFVEGMSIPHDRVMIVNLGFGENHGLEVMVPFGSTLEGLEEGLLRLKKVPPGGRTVANAYQNLLNRLSQTHMEFRRRNIIRTGDPLAPDPPIPPTQICSQVKQQWHAEIQSYSRDVTERVNDTVLILARLMQVVSGVPGYKSLLYIGGGLELVPGQDAYAYANKICPGLYNQLAAQGNSRTTVMKRLTELANTHRISFNAIEVAKSSLAMITSADQKFSQYTPGSTVEQIRTINLQNGLVMPASETGGKAFLNRDGFFPGLEVLERELFTYYSLGYTPSHTGSKESHSIKIKLKRHKGLQLRYRSSFMELPEAMRREDKLMSVLALGWSDNPLEVRLEHGEVKPVVGENDTFLVPLSVTVPLANLVCIPGQASDSSCRVRLQMRASDEKNRVSQLYEKLYDIHLTNNATSQGEVTLLLSNKMRRGSHRLVVSVMDDMARIASYLVYPVPVGSS